MDSDMTEMQSDVSVEEEMVGQDEAQQEAAPPQVRSRKAEPPQPRMLKSEGQKAAEAEVGRLVSELKNANEENEELILTLQEQEEELASIRSEYESYGKEREYIQSLLRSSGVPDMGEGEASLADQIVFLNSQRSVAVNALSTMRSDLTSLAHALHAKGEVEMSSRVLSILETSNKLGSFVMVSDVN